jgi:hypothetical protein
MTTELAQRAYEAYGNARDWKVFDGSPMPTWDEQDEPLKHAWRQAAWTVMEMTMDMFRIPKETSGD